MRILRVAQNLYPEVPGGGTYHAHALSRDQAEMGHDVTVLTVSDDETLPRREERAGYTVVRQPQTAEAIGNQISFGALDYLLRGPEFDVVHAHSHLYFLTNVACFDRVLGDTPLALTNHGLYSQTAPEWLFDLYLRTLGRLSFEAADVVFCYTETDRRRVRSLGVESRIEVVSNGIDTTRFRPDGPSSEHIDHDAPVVLFVGRLVDGKNPRDILGAFVRLKQAVPDVALYFCGDGPLRETLAEEARSLGIADDVTFLGQIPYEEMPSVYRSSDVLVLPSRAEGLPRVVLEAVSSGVPVVSNELRQIESVVSGNGDTVDTTDPAAFADAIRDWIEDGWSVHGLDDSYRWRRTVEETTEVLELLCRADGQ